MWRLAARAGFTESGRAGLFAQVRDGRPGEGHREHRGWHRPRRLDSRGFKAPGPEGGGDTQVCVHQKKGGQISVQ